MVANASLVYAKPPTGAPVPGETLVRRVDEIDIDTVPLDGGILVQNKVRLPPSFRRSAAFLT